MEVGFVGLGRMGSNMVRRLLAGGHRVVVYDVRKEAMEEVAREGAIPSQGWEDVTQKLCPRRVVWVMVPAGDPTESALRELSQYLEERDIVIDGGNSYFEDTQRRAQELAARGIVLLDVGTSGGIWGREAGYCLMAGGPKEAFDYVEPLLQTLAPGLPAAPRTPGRTGAPASEELGYLWCGPSGTGHFVKMVHNGIEYGLMQAYAEGFDLLSQGHRALGDLCPQLPLARIAELWRRGSVIRSWLLDLVAMALHEDALLSRYTGIVEDSGEGRWTLSVALRLAVPMEAISSSLFRRFRSRQDHPFSEKMLSAMRQKFGGHIERPTGG
ncbi:phosphogluconate dehydrogenase (NAD(+)-dependent, decarboxylating) [Candidatus Methylacidithermus pantelleriae]|uniref:NAD-dependent 6-phosphogluconate dehydrogenase n=1 Tax=Candidatus Methylacidithermus pantelleriae TaxID=2744239 RepID=A0A8J2FP21_9BACT|nr:decarboxylating 6-phosphogluconate dehydrogenase [Candidatus Methylacidithermus pantelleriae]CAF0699264.1 NAD-dependent 6-phosphogluconate dehydrogenase [Candidatus Methylacidithermus pantelleriae]